jgi:chromate transporter
MIDDLLALAALFGHLSLLAFGGGNTVLPEMQREAVEVHGWMNAADFAALFALAQAAPGPNMMISALIGLRVAGLPGAAVATLGMIVPSSALTVGVCHAWDRFRHASWRRKAQAGITPVTVGLVLAAAAIVAEGADRSLALAAVTVAVALLTLFSKVHPLWLMAAGAVLGAIGAV